MLRNDLLEAWDRENFFHPSTHLAQHTRGESATRVIRSASGVFIEDRDGNRLLDGFAGLYCVNVGYGRQEIAEAIAEQARELAYYHAYVGHGTEASITLSKMILERAPQNMSKVYFGLGGSDANETNVKLIWYYNNIRGLPQKKKIISRWRGYHGSGIMTGSLTGLAAFHNAFDLPRAPILHTTCPHHYWNADAGETEAEFAKRCADDLEKMILREGPETVAAFIGEPVMGTGGIITPPEGYWDAIQKVLNKYDVLLVADEVVTAFGRTGSYFGSHHYGMKPDLITIAKGVTSGYLPLSGVIIGERVWKVLEQGSDQMGPIGHGWTYSAHPVCAAAANANLDIVDGENLTGNAADTGGYFQKRLRETFNEHPLVGEARGVGLMAALEFVADKTKKERFDPNAKIGPRVSAACLERGMIARAMPHGDILGFAPPLCITKVEIDKVIDIAKQAVDAVANEVASGK
jgi:L-2,4-diaminobutyrate transaminase